MIVMVMSISIKSNLEFLKEMLTLQDTLQPYFIFIDFILMLTKLDKKLFNTGKYYLVS